MGFWIVFSTYSLQYASVCSMHTHIILIIIIVQEVEL